MQVRIHHPGVAPREPESRNPAEPGPESRLPKSEVRKFFVAESENDAGVRRQDRRRRRLRQFRRLQTHPSVIFLVKDTLILNQMPL